MFLLSSQEIRIEQQVEFLKDSRCGAVATFEGRVRDHNDGREVVALEYEAYGELALSEGRRIIEEAHEKFDIYRARCIHRTGSLALGELAVWVGVSSSHRENAFGACRYIIDEAKSRLPIWKKEHYADQTAEWVNCSEVGPSTTPLPFDESDYYDRQVRLAEVGRSGQARLKAARVLVVGAGGLGSAALQYLAAAGVGHIGICEYDHLHVSNLHRQVLFRHEDTGRPKAELAADRLRQLNPFVNIQTHPQELSGDNVAGLFSDYDLVLDCTDNFAAKFLINDAAVLSGTLLVQASIYRFEGQLQSIRPGSPCLRCEWPEIPEERCAGSCAEVGVLGVVPGIFGTLQAAEAIKQLLDLPGPLDHHVLLMDLLDYRVRLIERSRNPACPVCGAEPSVTEILSENYAASWLIDPAALSDLEWSQYELVDIREADERKSDPAGLTCLELPLSEFDGARGALDPNRAYLLFCQRARRSSFLADRLRKQGFKRVFSVLGGVEAARRRAERAPVSTGS